MLFDMVLVFYCISRLLEYFSKKRLFLDDFMQV